MNNFEPEWQRFSQEAMLKKKNKRTNVLLSLTFLAAVVFVGSVVLDRFHWLFFAAAFLCVFITFSYVLSVNHDVMNQLNNVRYVPEHLKGDARALWDKSLFSLFKRLEKLFLTSSPDEVATHEKKESDAFWAEMPWQKIVAKRLNFALNELKSAQGYSHYSESVLAEQAGFLSPVSVIAAFEGKEALNFDRLDQLARTLGVSAEWLKHGNGNTYPIGYEKHLPHGTDDALAELFKPEETTSSLVRKLYFFRADNERGELVIIRVFDEPHLFDVWQTPYVLSEQVGDNGERDQEHLLALWRELYLRPANGGKAYSPNLVIKSYLIDPRVLHGKQGFEVHPLRWPEIAHNSAWWEDVWENRGPGATIEHWDGMQTLRSSVLSRMQAPAWQDEGGPNG